MRTWNFFSKPDTSIGQQIVIKQAPLENQAKQLSAAVEIEVLISALKHALIANPELREKVVEFVITELTRLVNQAITNWATSQIQSTDEK